MTYQDVGGLLTYTDATLLHRRQHRVARRGSLSVGKTTDTDILRHPHAHILHRVENTDSRIVIDGKECIRIRLVLKQRHRHLLGCRTVVALAGQTLVKRQTMLQQRILITIEAVLGYLQIHRTAKECDITATSVYQIGHGIISPQVVVNHHTTGIHASTDTIIEHQGYTRVYQALEMLVLLRILGLRYNDAAHLTLIERPAQLHLTLIALATLSHHDMVTMSRSLLLNTFQYRVKVVMYQLGHDDTNHLLRLNPAVAQRLGQHVRCKIMLTCISLDHLATLLGDTGRIFQGTRHSSDRDS